MAVRAFCLPLHVTGPLHVSRKGNYAMDWITTEHAARMAGLKPGTLRQRRRREGDRHPTWTTAGSVVLYERHALARYITRQVDGRTT
jgi:predicted acyl esterase